MSEIELPEPQWWYTDDSQAAMNMGFGLPEEKPLYTAEQVRAAIRAERSMLVAMQAAWKTQLVEAGLPDGVAAKIVEETCDRIAAAIRRGSV